MKSSARNGVAATVAGAVLWATTALSACGFGSSNDAGTPSPDGGDSADSTAPDGEAPDSAGDSASRGGSDGDASDAGAPLGAGDAGVTGYSLLVTESPPGPTIAQDLWEGVLRFTIAASGAPPLAVAGIDKSLVSDPIGLAFRASSSEIFVGNRYGNIAPGGVSGSISRFKYDPATGAVTPNGAITGNGLNEVSQIVFHPTTGEMFAANLAETSGVTPTGGPAISRFTFDSADNAVAHGTLGDTATQGISLAPDGNSIYATSGGVTDSTIRQYDLASGTVSVAATVSGAPRLFYMAVRSGELYVAALDVNEVVRFTIGAGGALTAKDSFGATGPLALTFSPDGTELFTAGHLTTNVIDRFAFAPATDTWTPVETITTPSSLGGVVTIPGAAGSPVDGGIVVGDASPE